MLRAAPRLPLPAPFARFLPGDPGYTPFGSGPLRGLDMVPVLPVAALGVSLALQRLLRGLLHPDGQFVVRSPATLSHFVMAQLRGGLIATILWLDRRGHAAASSSSASRSRPGCGAGGARLSTPASAGGAP